MKCRDCSSCKKGWFSPSPDEYVCIGVKYPFIINDIDAECTEYEDKHNMTAKEYVLKNFSKEEILDKIIFGYFGVCVEEFGIRTEYSHICIFDCEECWNSKVVKKFKR